MSVRWILAVGLSGLLAACSGGDHEDLRQWMRENTKNMRGHLPALPEAKPYEPVPYDVQAMLDPFKPGKIEPESKQGRGKVSGLQPDFDARDRRASELERYPLESLALLGVSNINNRPVAFIRAGEKTFTAKVGDYIGMNFGRITEISGEGADRRRDNSEPPVVRLQEMVEDSAGDWSERTNTLYLQGKEGGKK